MQLSFIIYKNNDFLLLLVWVGKKCSESSHGILNNIILAKVFSLCWSSSVIILLNYHGHRFVHWTSLWEILWEFWFFFFFTHSVLKSSRFLGCLTFVFSEPPSPSGDICRMDHQCALRIFLRSLLGAKFYFICQWIISVLQSAPESGISIHGKLFRNKVIIQFSMIFTTIPWWLVLLHICTGFHGFHIILFEPMR